MEPPSAAVYFFHLNLPSSLLFIFICIPKRSSSTGKKHTERHILMCLSFLPLRAWKKGSKQTMCRLWGYQCVPFIVLRRRDFYTNFAVFFLVPWQCFHSTRCRLHERKSICIEQRKNSSSSGNSIREHTWNIVNILPNMHHFLYYCTRRTTTYCLPPHFAIFLLSSFTRF